MIQLGEGIGANYMRSPLVGMGSFAIIKDPAGAMLGLWELTKS